VVVGLQTGATGADGGQGTRRGPLYCNGKEGRREGRKEVVHGHGIGPLHSTGKRGMKGAREGGRKGMRWIFPCVR